MAFVSYSSQTKIGLEGSIVFRLWPLNTTWKSDFAWLSIPQFLQRASFLFERTYFEFTRSVLCRNHGVWWLNEALHCLRHMATGYPHQIHPRSAPYAAVMGIPRATWGKKHPQIEIKMDLPKQGPTQFWSCRVVQYDAFYFYNNKLHVAYRMSWGLKAKKQRAGFQQHMKCQQ